MKSVLLGLVFISSLAFGQNDAIPFELERFKEYPMAATEVSDNPEDLTAGELLLVFHSEYKRIRAKKPSNYFPELSGLQKEIKDLMESKHPDHAANALIQFLESGCTQENLESLISHPAEIKVLLPYQFIAAFALEDIKKEKMYIEAMLREGMLSDVLKSWGEAAVKSAYGNESIMTNGMQDLLAVRYAQQIKNLSPDVMVANKFVQKCGLSEDASAFGRMWFAPTLQKNVISPFSARLKVVGIGFAFESSTGSNLMEQTTLWILQGSVSQTPADKGLVSSYGYLQKALAEAGIATEAERLKKYIDQEGM